MSYTFISGDGSVLTADSSIVSGIIQRPIINIGSVLGSIPVVISGNPSVSGTVGASVIGTVPVTQSGAWSASLVGVIPGSVVAFQGTPEWTVKSSIAGGIFPISGSVAATIVGTPNVNVAGSVVASQGTTEWTVKSSIAGGIFPISGSVAATVTNFPTDQNVSGSVVAFLTSTNASVITVGAAVANQSVSGTVGASVIGTVPVTQSGAWSASLVGIIPGSVVAFQGGTQITSIVGAYAEDSAHTTADIGVFTLGVRNDNVASLASANLDYTGTATDSAGRALSKPFAAEEARIEGYNSVVSGSVTTLVAAAGAGLRNYITDIWVANTGASATLVTFRSQGGTSILGYTIAPAGGGSNITGLQTPIRTGVNETFDIQATTSTSILFATVKGFKAP